ncbi:hypothetical protein Tco_0877120 [Tanacetum coccineum]|uniref:Reverse transcriptase domain-containing protein n=1 Tax=Tanacetum coccineum TaxID=301880 RepID=A0ABQ5BZZ6_9ASTR
MSKCQSLTNGLISLLRNKEKLEEIAIYDCNANVRSIIMNKVPEKLEDPGKFLIPCALQELKRTSALADSGASINLLPYSIYKKLELEALTPTRMTSSLPIGNFHQNSVIESLPMSPILVEDSEPTQEEIDILLVPDNLIPPGVEDADSEDEVNESPNLDHQNDPSIPRPPPEPPDIEKCFEPKAGILIIKEFKGVSKSHDFMTSILPTLVLMITFISSIVSFENEDTIFDPGIVTFLRAGGIF